MALGITAEKGDKDSIYALVFRLKDHVGFSRTSTVKALGSIAEEGDRDSIEALVSQLENELNVLKANARSLARSKPDCWVRGLCAFGAWLLSLVQGALRACVRRGPGPEVAPNKLKANCEELGPKNTFLLGSRSQDLAEIYSAVPWPRFT